MTKVRTQLDKERLAKIQQGEGQAVLDEMTQADEAKAADFIIGKEKEAEKVTLLDKFEKEESLRKKRELRGHKEYIHLLAKDAFEMARHIDLPVGWTYYIGFNEKKIAVTITSSDGKKYGRGIEPCGNQVYDLHAVGVLLTQAENTVDQVLERGAYRKDGIILPNGAK